LSDTGTGPDAPAAVLTYAGSGIPRLRAMLEVAPEMEWLAGVNLLQLCDRIARDWSAVDGRDGRLPMLAQRGISALLESMLVPRLAASGKRRWCTPALASTPTAAGTFAAVFPHARFVSLHRNCLDVIYAGLAACPWGLAGSGQGFDGFAAAHPGNSVAALADYWCSQTQRILDVEDAYPARCIRVRYEDLDADPDGILREIRAFLGLSPMNVADIADATSASAVGCGAEVPADRIPSHLLARVDSLTQRLGYRAPSG
jgi:Sulfotransferase family